MLQRLRTLSTVGFLVLIFAGLASLAVHAVRHRDNGIQGGIGQEWSWRGAIDGSLTAALGRSIDEALPGSPALDGWVDGLLYRTLGDTGPQVRAGCNGWLYLAEELVETPNGAAHLSERVALAKAIAAELAGKGVGLVVVPVPDKALNATEGLCGLEPSTQARARPQAWRDQSATLGLTQVDIGKDWPLPGYWRTDTHWNQDGARHAAALVGAAIVAKAGPGTVSIDLQTAAEARDRSGDLVKLAGLDKTESLFGPAPDHEFPVSLKIERTGGLLDDAPAPDILLAGSSYSLNSGFHDYLQAAASREIAQKSLAGGGFAGAVLDVLANSPDLLKQVKLVVWEWPVRSLSQPLTEQEKKFLDGHVRVAGD